MKKTRKSAGGHHWKTTGLKRTGIFNESRDVSMEQLQKDINEGYREFWSKRSMEGVYEKTEFVPKYGINYDAR